MYMYNNNAIRNDDGHAHSVLSYYAIRYVFTSKGFFFTVNTRLCMTHGRLESTNRLEKG